MEISVLKVPKTLNIELLYNTAVLLLSLYKKKCKSGDNSYLHTYVHHNILCNSCMGLAYMYINKLLDKENATHTHKLTLTQTHTHTGTMEFHLKLCYLLKYKQH